MFADMMFAIIARVLRLNIFYFPLIHPIFTDAVSHCAFYGGDAAVARWRAAIQARALSLPFLRPPFCARPLSVR